MNTLFTTEELNRALDDAHVAFKALKYWSRRISADPENARRKTLKYWRALTKSIEAIEYQCPVANGYLADALAYAADAEIQGTGYYLTKVKELESYGAVRQVKKAVRAR